eukprot:COSAG06_NODE_3983_length_4683_cov_305.602701_2_plen_104_part_00
MAIAEAVNDTAVTVSNVRADTDLGTDTGGATTDGRDTRACAEPRQKKARRQQQQPQRQRHQQPPPVGSTLIIAERIQAGVAAFVLNKRVLAASGLINAKPHRA